MKVLLLLSLLFRPVNLSSQPTTRQEIDLILGLVTNKVVKRVQVLRIPDDVSTIIAVTPDALRAGPSYSIVLNDGFQPALEGLLSGLSGMTSDKDADVHWGMLFFDGSGKEVGSIFCDRFGARGYLNGRKTSFTGNIAARMRKFVQELR